MLTDIALAMIGFLLGQKISRATLRESGKTVLCLSLSLVLVSVALVASVLTLFNIPLELALLLAGIATATDPAATVDVVSEMKAQGKFTDTLLDIVAIDDAWGLLVFSLLLAIVQLLDGQGGAGDILFTPPRASSGLS